LPLLSGGIAYINGGPLVRTGRSHDLDHLAECLVALRREYVDRRRLVLRVLAPTGDPEWNDAVATTFNNFGLRATDRTCGYRTLLLDITRPPEEIRASFLQKWRNGLNGAERQGLEIESGNTDDLLERFCLLFKDFLSRKSFDLDLSAGFYTEVQREHLQDERYFVSLANQNGVTIAGHVSSMEGDTCVYLLGATHPDGLKSKAAYLLQWHTILAAKENGLSWYDLGGIDPEGNPGVYRFKKGMNGIEVRAAGPCELIPNGLTGHLTLAAESSYRTVQSLQAKWSEITSQVPRTQTGDR
jgi:lipid II:glycine glycyltransferase (peptidoglycan interpeptide bridge formation enzyme)